MIRSGQVTKSADKEPLKKGGRNAMNDPRSLKPSIVSARTPSIKQDPTAMDLFDTLTHPLADGSPELDQLESLRGRYAMEEEIARGGMGVVYRAHHRGLDRRVAIKLLRPGQSDARFVREARILASIKSPRVVTVYDLEELPDGKLFLAMEWIESDIKKQMAAAAAPIEESRAIEWMGDTCAGMIALEQAGVIHRDLKPSNILVDGQGNAVVADLGLARAAETMGIDHCQTESSGTMGTPLYMAPEQAEDPRAADVRSDIYSFGATFFHALTGRPPFEGKTAFSVLYKHKMEPLLSPRSLRADLSDQTSQLLERCLAKAPRERFQSFAEVLSHCQPGSSLSWDATEENLRPYVARLLERRDDYLNRPRKLSEPDVFEFPNGRRILIVSGDITNQKVDALVSSDDQYLSMGGGVSWSLLKQAGVRIRREIEKLVPVRPGRAIVTSAGDLPARFIFHGVTMTILDQNAVFPSPDLIQEILASCFYHADTLFVESIALPLLGTGAGGFARDKCLDVMFRYLCRSLLSGLTSVKEARIVIYPLATLDREERLFHPMNG